MALGEYLGAGSGTTLGLYHLNGDATDDSGNDNDGTATDVTWEGGILGSGCARFDGTAYIKPNDINYSTDDDFVLVSWAKTTQTTGVGGIYGDAWFGTSPGSVCNLLNNTSIGEFRLRVGSTTSNAIKLGTTDISDGEWHCLIGTFRASDKLMNLYIDGELDATDNYTATTGDFYNSNSDTDIGRVHYKTTPGVYTFTGDIDECFTENVYWSAEDVKKYYTYAKGRFGIL